MDSMDLLMGGSEPMMPGMDDPLLVGLGLPEPSLEDLRNDIAPVADYGDEIEEEEVSLRDRIEDFVGEQEDLRSELLDLRDQADDLLMELDAPANDPSASMDMLLTGPVNYVDGPQMAVVGGKKQAAYKNPLIPTGKSNGQARDEKDWEDDVEELERQYGREFQPELTASVKTGGDSVSNTQPLALTLERLSGLKAAFTVLSGASALDGHQDEIGLIKGINKDLRVALPDQTQSSLVSRVYAAVQATYPGFRSGGLVSDKFRHLIVEVLAAIDAAESSMRKGASVEKSAGFDTPESEATELQLYVENDRDLYRQQMLPVLKNLATKKARDQYDHELAVKGMMYLVDRGAQKYAKEFGSQGQSWNEMFPRDIRRIVAENLVNSFETEFDLGNYDNILPKKYQKTPAAAGPTEAAVSLHIKAASVIRKLDGKLPGVLVKAMKANDHKAVRAALDGYLKQKGLAVTGSSWGALEAVAKQKAE